MKLLFAIKTVKKSKGGSERVISMVASGLSRRGYDVKLITFDKKSGECLYPLDKEVKLSWLEIGDAGNKATFFESWLRLLALRKFITKEKPDLIIAFQHSMFVLVAFSLLGKRFPVIASEHIVPQHYKGKLLEYFLMCFAGYLSDRITVLSNSIKKMYPGFLQTKMITMPNPVLYSKEIKNREPSKKNKYTILNVGRLDGQKDQETLIRAFVRLKDKYPNWSLHIIGSGKLKDELDNLIISLNASNSIKLESYKDNIFDSYQSADIFAIPSKYESFGLVTAEAMSCELPVVGFSDCPGTNELILDGVNGILVLSNDRVKNFSEGLEKLMADPELRYKLGKRGRQDVKKFKTSHVLDKWEVLINEFNS